MTMLMGEYDYTLYFVSDHSEGGVTEAYALPLLKPIMAGKKQLGKRLSSWFLST